MQARVAASCAASTAALPEDGYHGEYIREIAQRYLAAQSAHDLATTSRRSAASRSPSCASEQDLDLQAFGVTFDIYFLETSLYTDGQVERDGARARGVGQDLRAGRRAVAARPPTSATTRTA